MKIVKPCAILLLFVSLNAFASKVDLKGPKLLIINKEYIYTIKVSDFKKGDNLKVYVPGNCNVLGVSKKGKVAKSSDKKNFVLTFNSDSVNLKPSNEVKIKISPINLNKGNAIIRAGIERKSKTIEEGEVAVKIIGVPDIKIGIYDTEDPVEIGKETTYVIEVTNIGSSPATSIKTGFILPKECSYSSAKAPKGIKFQAPEASTHRLDTETIGFLSSPILKAKKKLTYRVTCKAKLKGSASGVAFVTYDQTDYPVFEIEGTSLY